MQPIDLEKIIDRLSLIKMGDRVVCLVSGGVDSMVLLETLHRHSRHYCFGGQACGSTYPLTVLHFNYHLRGEESDRDEEFVRNESTRRGVPVVVIEAPLNGKSAIQERARELRRKRTVELAREYGWNIAAMAHQANDQLETVVMRMIRGAGVRGLRGMDRETELAPDLRLIRPLLGVSRKKIVAFARREGILYVEDSSNRGGRYFRNRVRHLLLPQLKKGERDLVGEAARASERFRREHEANRLEAEAFLLAHAHTIPMGRFFQLPDPVRFLVLEKLLKENGFAKEVNRCHATEIESLLRRPGKTVRFYGEACFLAEEGVFSFTKQAESANLCDREISR